MSWFRLAIASGWALFCTVLLLVNGYFFNGNTIFGMIVIANFALGEVLIAAEFSFDWFGRRRQPRTEEQQVHYVHLPTSERPIVY